MDNLLLEYRPRTLGELLGQPEVARALKLFAADPCSTAMIFHGESGVGKTSAAYALANDLGIAVEEGELGGLHELSSGEMNGAAVRESVNSLRLGTLFGSGWKMLIANECDRMTPAAETIWLDALEHLPPRSVIIFTTNAPEKLTRRFRDRCESFHFQCDPDILGPDISRLARRIWREKVGKGEPPQIESLGMPTLGDLESMHASFRLAVQQIGRLIREAKAGADPRRLKKAAEQIKRDLLVSDGLEFSCECDHCGHEQDVKRNAKRHTCEECGESFSVEL